MNIFVGCLAFCAFAAAWPARADDPQNKVAPTPSDKIKTLGLLFERREVKQVELIYIPTNILTRTRISPEWLDKNFLYKLVVKEIPGSRIVEGFRTAVRKTVPTPLTERPDVRWGCVVRGPGSEKLFSIYLNSSGEEAVIDGEPAKVSPHLHKWLEDEIARCFQ